MTSSGREAHQRLGKLLEAVTRFGTRTAKNTAMSENESNEYEGENMTSGNQRKSIGIGAGMATLVSIIAMAFSGYSFYETVLKQASLRVYQPPLIHMYREGYRDVLAIPITISNDGAKRGTVLSFDLTVTSLDTNKSKNFQNLNFGDSPKGKTRLFNPITVPGRSSFSDVVLFYAMETGAFMETTGGVKLPLRLTLKMNIDDTGGMFAPAKPPPITFDMTANYVASFRDMENDKPTRLHDERWQQSNVKK